MESQRPICMELVGTVNIVRRAMAEEEKNQYGLSGIQHWVLGYINRHQTKGPIFQKNIESVFALSRSAASELLQKMEREKLIKRVPLEEDGRLKKIILLPKGVKANKESVQVVKKMNQLIEEGLDRTEIQQLRRTLEIIRKNMKSGGMIKEERRDENRDQKICKEHS